MAENVRTRILEGKTMRENNFFGGRYHVRPKTKKSYGVG